MIKRRLVYQVAGYDPVSVEGHHRRFVRGIATFERTWNVTAAVSDPAGSAAADSPARWTVTTRSGNWQVQATYQPLPWDDIVLADFARPTWRRLVKFAAAFLEFVGTGTAFQYFRARFKYGLFFLFPAVYLAAFAVIGVAAGWWMAGHWQLNGLAHVAATAAIGSAGFLALLRWPGRRWRVNQALDDWIFSWDYLHGRRPDVEAKLDRFAQDLVNRARETEWDEILVIGHSIGATLAIHVVARALELDPELGRRGPSVCVLTVGSTIAKFTLHPDAERTRRDVAAVAAASSVDWAEYHARADPISFYKFDAASGPIERDRFDRKPIIRIVRIRSMLELRNYRRIQPRFMRLHHQFVMANQRRATYDFYIMGCGPIPFDRTVRAKGGPADLIAEDGGFIGTLPATQVGVAAAAVG